MQSCGFVFWLIFEGITCILHHFAFLFGRQLVFFFNSKYPLLAPKTLLFNGYFAYFSHIFNDSKRFYLYHCSVSLCFLSCI